MSASGQDALLLWCQENTKGYKRVCIKDFDDGWKDGLALCALVDKFFPGKLNFETLSPGKPDKNIQLALDIAERNGISSLLDIEDLIGDSPDKAALITYLSQFYQKFGKAKTSRNPSNVMKSINVVVGKESTICSKCQQPLSGSSVHALSRNWHAECLTCKECGKSLVGGKVMNIKDNPYCSDCGKNAFTAT